MTFRKSSGNMYDFVSHTFNVIKGKCSHDCKYCYMKKFKQNAVRLDKKALKIDLGKDNFIFVGSSCDVFANDIPSEWIRKVLMYCMLFDDNKYLFQSKNPERMYAFRNRLPIGSVIGTTIETNREYPEIMGKCPPIKERAFYMNRIGELKYHKFETMVTIEPIMDFDVKEFVELLRIAKPTWVNIGADSKDHNLPEPSKEKILELVEEISKFTTIKKKHNLGRIL